MIRTAALNALHGDRAELDRVRAELEQTRTDLTAAQTVVEMANDSAIRAEDTAERLAAQLDQAQRTADEQFEGMRTVLGQATAERDAARAQVLLDAEDRVALRALLRTARRQTARTARVHVLFRYGALHSVHASPEAAEAAAEAEGAPREGWTSLKPGAALPPAAETPWRVQALPLGGVD
ncbi:MULTISPECIES: hypothetical protein [unclassified Streptomyces]|uniref:hypothetical protein n=1 Tax=unclassified Streptomyces TaxID=2593676 RepID=UPI001F53F36B|nr:MULTISPECIES: hypothetical protein [unclassified Streptomyces]